MIRILYQTDGICQSCSSQNFVSRITFTKKGQESEILLCEYCKNDLRNVLNDESVSKDIEDHMFVSIRNYIEDYTSLREIKISEKSIEQLTDGFIQHIYETLPDKLFYITNDIECEGEDEDE